MCVKILQTPRGQRLQLVTAWKMTREIKDLYQESIQQSSVTSKSMDVARDYMEDDMRNEGFILGVHSTIRCHFEINGCSSRLHGT